MKTITICIEEINPATGGYPLSLIEGALGESASVTEELPSNLRRDGQTLDPQTFPATLLATKGVSNEFAQFGKHLYDLLMGGAVGAKWRELRQNNPKQLRTLLDIRPPELSLLPWELLDDQLSPPLFTNKDEPFARATKFDEATGPAWFWPLRILILVGATRADQAVNVEDELKGLEDAIKNNRRMIDLEILELPTREKLQETCKEFKPHILHFLGHGAGPDALQSEPYLSFNLNDGAGWQWLRSEIRLLSIWDIEPRLVFLNACRTAAAATMPKIAESARSLAEAFHIAGVPAVIGMQADVRGDYASAFAGLLYERIADGDALDQALAAARGIAINKVNLTLRHRDWALPTLLLSRPPRQIFPMYSLAPASRTQEIYICEDFREQDYFANRKTLRREIIHSFYPPHADASKPVDAPPKRHLLVIHGKPESGKTAIVQWCMEVYARQQQEVRYIKLAGQGAPTWLDALCFIRDGDPNEAPNSLIHRPLEASAFYKFNWDLKHRLQGLAPPAWDQSEVAPVTSKGAPLPQTPEEKMVDKTFESFREALRSVAAEEALCIVLDDFNLRSASGAFAEMQFDFLRAHLIDYVARGEMPGVQMVLVLTTDEYEAYKLSNKKNLYPAIEIGSLNRSDFLDMAKEFFNYTGLDKDYAQTWIDVGKKVVKDPWQVSLLRTLHNRALELLK